MTFDKLLGIYKLNGFKCVIKDLYLFFHFGANMDFFLIYLEGHIKHAYCLYRHMIVNFQQTLQPEIQRNFVISIYWKLQNKFALT